MFLQFEDGLPAKTRAAPERRRAAPACGRARKQYSRRKAKRPPEGGLRVWWRRRESKTNRDARRARFRGEKARFGTLGHRVPWQVVHLSARLLVGLGRNRHRRRRESMSCGMWWSRRWRGHWCWLRRRSGGTWSCRSRRSSRHGGSSRQGEASVRLCPPPIVAPGNGNDVVRPSSLFCHEATDRSAPNADGQTGS